MLSENCDDITVAGLMQYGMKRKRSELRSCVKVEMTVPGSPSLIILMVSVDVKQH